MLIIYAHPNKSGHCGYILKIIIEVLKQKNQAYEIIDLYKIGYDPILKQNELYTIGNNDISSLNQEIQAKIKQNDKFIFIYPTWWQNTPAVLKGFFDRVLTRGFAFYFKSKIPVKLLKGKALVFTTTGGPRIYTYLFARDRSIKVVIKDILNFCGIKAKGIIIGNAIKLNDKQKRKIQKVINKKLNYLS